MSLSTITRRAAWVRCSSSESASTSTSRKSTPTAALASEGASEALFENKCAGCHANGGNVLAAGKSLRLEDLQRNQVAEINEIYSLVYSGKGKMPGFGKDCAPAGQCPFAARLSDEEVSGLAEYVDQRARDGWN